MYPNDPRRFPGTGLPSGTDPWGRGQPGYGDRSAPGFDPYGAPWGAPQRPMQTWGQQTPAALANPATFLTRVFGWMGLGLGITAATAAATAMTGLWQIVLGTPLFWLLILGEFGLVLFLSMGIRRMRAPTAMASFLVYSLLNGLTLSVIFLAYSLGSIASTFGVTAMTFGFMAVYGATTKRDLSTVGSIATMGLFGLILASVVNIFFASSALYWITTYAGILIFVALTAWDTQKIKAIGMQGYHDGEQQQKNAIIGALQLYLDFINLFLFILRLLGGRRD